MPLKTTGIGLLFCAAAAICACQSGDKSQKTAISRPAALVLTTDFESGSYSAIGMDRLEVAKNIGAIHQDSVCRFDPLTGMAFIVARLGADAIDVVNPKAGWMIEKEYSVGAGTNPQDIAVFSKERAYVSRLDEPDILVVDPISGDAVSSVDLSSYSDDDGIPELSGLYSINGKIFAAAQRLYRFLPTDYSSIAVIDAATGTPEAEIRLSAANPQGTLRYSEAAKSLVLIESGSFGALDGGIEYLNPFDGTLSGLVVTEKALGGDVVDAVVASEKKGYAIIGKQNKDRFGTSLVSFDPSSDKIVDLLLSSDEWDFASLELTPDATELWIADRAVNSPGVRILDVESDLWITKEPIDVGLPPSMICFVQ